MRSFFTMKKTINWADWGFGSPTLAGSTSVTGAPRWMKLTPQESTLYHLLNDIWATFLLLLVQELGPLLSFSKFQVPTLYNCASTAKSTNSSAPTNTAFVAQDRLPRLSWPLLPIGGPIARGSFERHYSLTCPRPTMSSQRTYSLKRPKSSESQEMPSNG